MADELKKKHDSAMNETGANFAEKVEDAEKKAKKWMKIIKNIAIIAKVSLVLIILISVIGLVVFLAGALEIKQDDKKTKAADAKNEAIGNEALGKVLEIDGNKYKITYNGKTGREALEYLLDDYNMNFSDFTEEELDVLYKCLRAEWATTYPNLGDSVSNDDDDYVQGVITLKRKAKDEVETPLTYIPYEQFEAKKNSNDTSVLNNFSMNNGNIVVAGWGSYETKYNITKHTSVPDDYINGYQDTGLQYTLDEKEINYRSMLGIHTLPFEFALTLLTHLNTPEFVDDLADVAFNSTLEITIYENTKEIITKEKEEIEEVTRYNKWVDYTITTIVKREIYDEEKNEHLPPEQYVSTDSYKDKKIDSIKWDTIKYDIETTTTTQSNSYIVGLSNIKSWFTNMEVEYAYNPVMGSEVDSLNGTPDVRTTGPEEREIEEISKLDSEVDKFMVDQYKTESHTTTVDGKRRVTTTQKKCTIDKARQQKIVTATNKTVVNTTQTNDYSYIKGDTKTSKTGESFEELYDKYPAVQGVFDTTASWMFKTLEKSESTIDYVTVLQYLLQICSGKDYGITEEEIEDLLNLFNNQETFSIDTYSFGSGNGSGWWWPIGSMETETKNGKLFASGAPALGKASVSRAGKKAGTYPGSSAGSHSSKAGGWAVDIRRRWSRW